MTEEKTKTNGKNEAQIPDGFEEHVDSFGPQSWYVREKNTNPITGLLLEKVSYEFRKKEKTFYRLKLGDGVNVKVMRKPDKDSEAMEFIAKKGDIVNVDATADIVRFMDKLVEQTERGGKYVVYLNPIDKEPLDNGNDIWRFRKASKTLRQPTMAKAPTVKHQEVDDSDIPF